MHEVPQHLCASRSAVAPRPYRPRQGWRRATAERLEEKEQQRRQGFTHRRATDQAARARRRLARAVWR